MRQFQYEYDNADNFKKFLTKVNQWIKTQVTSQVVFTIYAETIDEDYIGEVCDLIDKSMPDAQYFGCSTNGNIIDGKLCSKTIGITCTVFEFPSTKLELFQYVLVPETVHEVTADITEKINERKWVKAAKLLTTIRGMSMTGFCEDLWDANPEVNIFGGGAFAPDMNSEIACVFSKDFGYYDKGVVFALLGGEDMKFTTTYIAGWKPLGRELKVTRAKESMLYELDGKPAYETYYRYLNIKNDEHFFNNTLEFPFFYKHNGINILRAPIASNPDGSLTMTSDIDEGAMARIAYGDPWTILDMVEKKGKEIEVFHPEAINIFSCAARRTFWGNDEISKETLPFQSIAPTSGFYTSSEFLRTKGYVNQHNVTLVIVGMREGEYTGNEEPSFTMSAIDHSGKISMINRLATFIEAATEELEEANKKLTEMAIMDGLTQIYNRREIQRRIIDATKEYKGYGDGSLRTDLSLIMIDIDDFKKVNDTYGHKVGDEVLRGLASKMREILEEYIPDASCGRWGGEEFMILLPGCSADKAAYIAEKLRVGFNEIDFKSAGRQTISLGVTESYPDENPDYFCIRVDAALYHAKDYGKNQVVLE